MSLRFRLAAFAAVILTLSCGDARSALFDPLFRLSKVTGDVSVQKPGTNALEKALENHAYPYGTRIVVGQANPKDKTPVDPEVQVVLSPDHQFKLMTGADITISDGADADKKVFDVRNGKIGTFITVSTVKTGGSEDAEVEAVINAIVVKTPLAECHKLTERNQISVSFDGKYYSCIFASGGGMMDVSGPQFKILGMRRNSAVEVFGDKDFSRLSNVAGEFTGEIERGIGPAEAVSFKTRCIVKIWRSYADIGGKMAVSVMVAYPDGKINSYAYLAGETAVVDSSSILENGTVAVEKTPEGVAEETPATDTAIEAPADTTTAVIDTSATPAETKKESPKAEVTDSFDFGSW